MSATTGDGAPVSDVERRTVRCPRCGAVTEQLRRYPAWCASCDWNVDPAPPEPPRGRWARWLQRRGDQQVRALHATMLARGSTPSVTGAQRVLLMILACIVHLLTLSLPVAAIWLWTIPDLFRPIAVVGTVLLVGLFWVLRPRVGSDDIGGLEVTRDAAPWTFALLDEVSTTAGAPRIERLFLRTDYNAACTRHGRRRRTVLILGAPLWTVLSQAQRVALLGHEVGHLRNHDASRGLIVRTAQDALDTWTTMLLPDVARWRRMSAYARAGFGFAASTTNTLAAVERIAAVLLLPLAALVYLLGWAMDRLRLRDSQRAEYFADDLGSRLAGSAACAEMLDVLMLTDSERLAVRRTLAEGSPAQLWDRVRTALLGVPGSERERLRRVAAQRLQTIDATHPPTFLRRSLVLARPQPATSMPADTRWTAVDAELAGPLATLAVARCRRR